MAILELFIFIVCAGFVLSWLHKFLIRQFRK